MAPRDDDAERSRRRRRRELVGSRMRHPVGRGLPAPPVPPVVQRLAEIDGDEHPLDLLLEISALLHDVEDAEDAEDLADLESPVGEASGPHDREQPVLGARELVDLLVEHDGPATTTALAVLGRLAPDDVLRARARREVRLRDDELPRWLPGLTATAAPTRDPQGRVRLEVTAGPARAGQAPLAVLHARLDERGEVVGGSVSPSRPLGGWPDCRALLRWATRVAPGAAAP